MIASVTFFQRCRNIDCRLKKVCYSCTDASWPITGRGPLHSSADGTLFLNHHHQRRRYTQLTKLET